MGKGYGGPKRTMGASTVVRLRPIYEYSSNAVRGTCLLLELALHARKPNLANLPPVVLHSRQHSLQATAAPLGNIRHIERVAEFVQSPNVRAIGPVVAKGVEGKISCFWVASAGLVQQGHDHFELPWLRCAVGDESLGGGAEECMQACIKA